MGQYILKRFRYMLFMMLLISIVAFFIIQLPPGDYLSSYLIQLAAQGGGVNDNQIESLTKQYGLDKSPVEQYSMWITNILFHGDFGESFEWKMPVSKLLWGRIGITTLIGVLTIIFTYIVAIPIGVYSALHKYSFFDFLFTTIGYVGLALPGFMVALGVLYFIHCMGGSVGGLYSIKYLDQAMSIGKFFDMVGHIMIAVFIMGVAGIAGLIRQMRGLLLDELGKQYVTTARAKGLSETRLTLKYPVRLAVIPIVSTMGWMLAGILSGSPIVEKVLNLPTTGPLLLRALQCQDMYLAGSFILMLSTLTIIGTFVSDILLAIVDPRIRLD